MTREGTVLIVDDNRSILAALRLLLEKYFARVLTLPGPNALDATLREERVDVVLLDMNFTAGINTGNEGIYWLRQIRARRPEVQVVLFTAYADIDLAVQAMRDGAVDFVVKPWDNDRLVAALRNAYNLSRSQREVKQLKEIKRELTAEQPMFWGTSPAMGRIREIVEKVAATDANILITGENGTGKELVARALHAGSHRAGGPFVEVNCAAIPSELIESELFGHERGAFTSAIKQRKGKFEQADGGTLFMDEIGDMSLAAQAKVLRALQERRISRVGSDRDIEVDVRVIAATNKDLRREIERGNFREDLYHRIGVIVVHVPALREHATDIPLLVDHFLRTIAGEYGTAPKEIDAEAVAALQRMRWTGNVRELRNAVERLTVLSGERITAEDVQLYC
jgi:Response regulator containing CheY-like receiver, AAA-type ATPase, and DNA-binding domains